MPSAHDQVEVARRAAVQPRIALALQPDPLAVARARLDAELHRLGAVHHAFAVAGRAVVRNAPGPIAARAGDVEFHAAAHLRHLAGAVALRALHRAARRATARGRWGRSPGDAPAGAPGRRESPSRNPPWPGTRDRCPAAARAAAAAAAAPGRFPKRCP